MGELISHNRDLKEGALSGSVLQVLEFDSTILRKLLSDPVMAAKVLLGWDLDDFQAAALRIDWWVPETIDSSGISTGKTLRVFILVCLRCLLIPDHVAAVYFPNWQVGKDEFWPYFERTMEKSLFFRHQLKLNRKREGEHKDQGAWWMEFKNRSRIIMPAPNFMKDSETQAGRRFNTLVVDDWLRSLDMGDGLDKQLLDRVTRPCFNQDHPVWKNHVHLKGHAERPSHRGFQRVKDYLELMREGSGAHFVYSFCYKDISLPWRKMLLEKTRLKTELKSKSDSFMRRWLGIWTRDGATYYAEVLIDARRTNRVRPLTKRVAPLDVHILGVDFAPGQSRKADWCAFVAARLALAGLPPWNLPVTRRDKEGIGWNVSFPFAAFLRNKSPRDLSGYLHKLHQAFGFSLMVLDPQGGGQLVYKEMKEREQKFEGQRFTATPLMTRDEPNTVIGHPIVRFFKPTHFNDVAGVGDAFLETVDGLIAGFHYRFAEAFMLEEFELPLELTDWPASETQLWTPEIVQVQGDIDLCLKQLSRVDQILGEDGNPLVTKRGGFAMFDAPGKKDGAYAGFYCHAGVEHFFTGGAKSNGGDIADGV